MPRGQLNRLCAEGSQEENSVKRVKCIYPSENVKRKAGGNKWLRRDKKLRRWGWGAVAVLAYPRIWIFLICGICRYHKTQNDEEDPDLALINNENGIKVNKAREVFKMLKGNEENKSLINLKAFIKV